MATFKDDQCVQHVGNESHLSCLSSGLDQLRQQAFFCDVSIIVGDHRFPAHKAVLSSTSDYFQGMFSSGFQESTMREISVPGTRESFAQILDFAYTGYFTLSVQSIVDILKMACYMLLTDAMELCAKYLRGVKDKLKMEDSFEVWSIASNHGNLSDIAQLYRSHLLQNFRSCIESSAFLENCSAVVMMEFLSDEEIETDGMTEEQILQAALVWLKFNWEQRKVHTVDLLKRIRLGFVPVARLREILGDELLAIPECKDMVEEIIKLSVNKDVASPPLIKSHPELFASRNSVTARLEAGYDDSSSGPIIVFTCKTDDACYKINNMADIPNRYPYSTEKRCCVTAFVSNENQLYASVDIHYYARDAEDTERHDKWNSENNFFQYLPGKNEWIVLPPMPKEGKFINGPTMFHIKEYIYMFGEFEDNSFILRFSILNKSWEVLVDDTLLETYDAVLLPTGQILVKGAQRRAGPNLDGSPNGYLVGVAALYIPATNELLDVSVDGTLDEYSDVVEHDKKFFEHIWGDYPKKETQVNRLICDFDSETPTVVIAEATEDETFDVVNKDSNPEFTFDKRKLGLVQVPCDCESHMGTPQWRN